MRNFIRRAVLTSALVGVAAVFPALLPTVQSASAQEISLGKTDPNAQLLLQADELIYDNDAEVVTAKGNVQLDYDGYNVVADRVSYDQRTKRVKARGRVEILEPDGNRIFADEIDLTDDFGDGFVNALRVETPDNTRFAAESAERFGGQKTVFHHGVYTACEACKENPEKPPIWQVKAEKVILNGVTKTVTYEKATFELFGMPIAYLPYFSHADPSVKRKSGFLVPSAGHDEELGFHYRQAYFWAVSDTQDLTVTGTGYSKQGFLAQAEWKQQFDNGYYTLQAAGIRQLNKSEFSTSPDTLHRDRGLIATTGRFDINPRWSVGWNVMAQSDDTFGNTYNIQDYDGANITNYAYLRGLNGRSYFDLSGYFYDVQSTIYQVEDEQAVVLPTWDYNYVTTPETLGGDLTLDVNVTNITRADLSADATANIPFNGDQRTYGIDGDTTRASVDLGWKKTFNTGGLLLTPSLSLRADHTSVNGFQAAGSETVADGGTTRFMPTAAIEASYPLLIRTASSSHVVEPVAQLLLRPDLNQTGILPNEDAQSLVFDATTLFDHDKFSGYDRIESGTRANIGFRYSGTFDNGVVLDGLIGQSFHLSGDNPYKQADLVNVGLESGLDTDNSDYVAALGLSGWNGLSLQTQARFDNSDFEIQRSDVRASFTSEKLNASVNHTFIGKQPLAGFDEDRQQVGVSASYEFAENWKAFGAASFDVENGSLISDTVGLSYHDECFTFSLAFNQTRDRYTNDESDQSVVFKVGIRTLGDFDQSIDVQDLGGF